MVSSFFGAEDAEDDEEEGEEDEEEEPEWADDNDFVDFAFDAFERGLENNVEETDRWGFSPRDHCCAGCFWYNRGCLWRFFICINFFV